MKKLFRLIKEVFFAIRFFKNPTNYFKERFGLFSNRQITLHARNGLNFIIQAQTTDIRVLNEIWHLGVYDRFLKFIKNDSIVIDIGANIGLFSLKAAHQRPNVKVLSYEPFPRNFEVLKSNIALNHFEKKISAFNLAIAEEKGEKNFFFHPLDSGGGFFILTWRSNQYSIH